MFKTRYTIVIKNWKLLTSFVPSSNRDILNLSVVSTVCKETATCLIIYNYKYELRVQKGSFSRMYEIGQQLALRN